MNKSTLTLVGLLSFVMIFLGLNFFFTPFREAIIEQITQQEEVETPEETDIPSAVESVFNKFDDKDRVGQLLAWPVVITDDGEIEDNNLTKEVYLDVLSRKNPGFFTIFGNNISSISAKSAVDKFKEHNGSVLLPWVAVDHEGGKVQRLSGEGFIRMASWNSICKAEDINAKRILGKSARELSDVGIDIVLAPMVDIGLSKGVLNTRICSSNPDLVAKRSKLFIKTFKEQGIMSVIKHFPGIGNVKVDLHKRFAVGRVGIEDVFVYRTLLDSNPEIGVMVSHIGIDNQFADIPCSMSPDCINELSRNYQKTLIFSDALDMKSAFHVPESTTGAKIEDLSLADVTKKAVMAGNNVLIYGPSVNIERLTAVYDMLVREYNSDALFKKKVDKSVKKIISYKLGVPIEIEDEIQFKKLK